MIQSQSKLQVADNSGVKIFKCINVFGKSKKKKASIGDLVLGVVKSIRKNSKKGSQLKMGMLFKGVIIRQKAHKSVSLFSIKFSENAVVLLNSKNDPLGSRIFGSSNLQLLRKKKHLKILSLLSTVF